MTDGWSSVEHDALLAGLSQGTAVLLSLVEASGRPDLALLAGLDANLRRWALVVLLRKGLSAVASEVAEDWLAGGWSTLEEDRAVLALLFPDRANQQSALECLYAVEGYLAEERKGEAIALLERLGGASGESGSFWAVRYALSWTAAGNQSKALEAAADLRGAVGLLELRVLAAVDPASPELSVCFADVFGALRPATDPHHCLRVFLFALGIPELTLDGYPVFQPDGLCRFVKRLSSEPFAYYEVRGGASLLAVLSCYPQLGALADELLSEASGRLLRKKAIARTVGVMPTIEGLVARCQWETLRALLARGGWDRTLTLRAAQTAHYLGSGHTHLLAECVDVVPIRVAIALNKLQEMQNRATLWGGRCDNPIGWSRQIAFLP